MAPSNHLFVWGVSVMCIMVLISTYVNQKGAGDIRNEMASLANSVSKSIEKLGKNDERPGGRQVSCVGAATSEDVNKLYSKIEELQRELGSITTKLKNVEGSCQSAAETKKEGVEPNPEKSEPQSEPITEPKAEPKEPTEAPKKKETKKLMLAILASYTRAERRQAVRETWLQITKGTPRESEWTYKFFLAKPENMTLWDSAHIENDEHGDIVFFDHFLDTYRNLSRKTLAITKWAVDHYDFQYLFKTDDDAFVRLDRLLERLDDAPKEKYFAGISNGAFRPDRDKGSIWYVSEEDWPGDRPGPNVVTGAGYVLSYDCAEFMAKKAADPNTKYLPLEDVNTAVVLSEFGVGGVQFNGFLKGECPCRNEMILTHWCGPNRLRGFYSTMQKTGGNMC